LVVRIHGWGRGLKELQHGCWLAGCSREINVGAFGHADVLGTCWGPSGSGDLKVDKDA